MHQAIFLSNRSLLTSCRSSWEYSENKNTVKMENALSVFILDTRPAGERVCVSNHQTTRPAGEECLTQTVPKKRACQRLSF